jgi:hypothetical protein
MNGQQGNPSSGGSMLKTGDQPRATDKSIASERQPPSMSYVRYQPRGASMRSNSSRTGRS